MTILFSIGMLILIGFMFNRYLNYKERKGKY